MDSITFRNTKKYDRVMPRVYNRSRLSLKSSSLVMRHDKASSVRLSEKPSVSKNPSFSDLPTVLNDYIPDSCAPVKPVKRTFVVKPRKTLKSLDPALSPPRPPNCPPVQSKKAQRLHGGVSDSLLTCDREKCSDFLVNQGFLSQSHSKLKDLKEEIQAYHSADKLMKLRSHLYQNCGVVLDDVGYPAADKATQVEDTDRKKPKHDENDYMKRSEQRTEREDARTSVSDEQMRAGPLRYPVDRYLVESGNKFEMVNIIDDELWNPEPALRPEDEIILRKLHEMLQSTADDLRLLSGELSKFHEPGVQIKTAPTPLDEEFNEKVHIEEVVNAKFHGYKMVETQNVPEVKPRNDIVEETKSVINNQRPKVMNTRAQVNTTITKRPVINRNLGVSKTKIVQINVNNKDSSKNEKLNNGEVYKASTVAYNEFCYKHIEPEVKKTTRNLQVQDMPRINIRSELKEQKVLQLDIIPNIEGNKTSTAKSNVSVVAIRYEIKPEEQPVILPKSPKNLETLANSSKTVRKFLKMSTCDSSASANNISSDAQVKLNTQKRIISTIRNSPKSSARNRVKKTHTNKNEQAKHLGLNLDEWKKKLNTVYASSGSKNPKHSSKVTRKKSSPKKINAPKTLNNAEYIPYSKLTIGGVRVSEIEREISHLPNKNNIPLSPILDKILSSRENSFNQESPRKHRFKDNPQILTTSDENLLQEVIDIEKSISETLSKNLKEHIIEPVMKSPTVSSECSSDKENESYADDFEDEKSEYNGKLQNPQESDGIKLDNSDSVKSNLSNPIGDLPTEKYNDEDVVKPGPSKPSKNATYTKSNLTFKDSVDIFEYIHSIDMQDTATQSNTSNKISPKETQTSPRKDKPSLQPTIHNDLWPSIDPRREVEKMFEMEKDFIKKLIIDEYGDLLEKNIKKPSTSNENQEEDTKKNVSVVQKNTQTSPAHVKSVMTSPKRTKTRTTSPFNLTVPSASIHQQTSPAILVTDDERRVDIANEADDISVNLSSPRFSLRLPQNSREVFSNLAHTAHTQTSSRISARDNDKNGRKTAVSSTSSVDADNSSSELSSLGEVRLKRLRKRVPSISECSSSSKYSSDFLSLGILPLRSEGEISQGQIGKNRMRNMRQSEGETSFDPL